MYISTVTNGYNNDNITFTNFVNCSNIDNDDNNIIFI